MQHFEGQAANGPVRWASWAFACAWWSKFTNAVVVSEFKKYLKETQGLERLRLILCYSDKKSDIPILAHGQKWSSVVKVSLFALAHFAELPKNCTVPQNSGPSIDFGRTYWIQWDTLKHRSVKSPEPSLWQTPFWNKYWMAGFQLCRCCVGFLAFSLIQTLFNSNLLSLCEVCMNQLLLYCKKLSKHGQKLVEETQQHPSKMIRNAKGQNVLFLWAISWSC